MVGLQRCIYRYRSRREDDVRVRERLKQLARKHPPQRSAWVALGLPLSVRSAEMRRP